MTVAQGTRSIRLDSLTRVEGEGGIRIDVHDGRLEDVKLEIYEPPRLFEAFLRGRSIREAPDIVARICGICPYAHQLTAAQAIESALGITPGEEIRSLRRLFYCAEWIESHALHIYMLQAPDYFGVENVVALAAKQPEAVQRGLELKKIGNEVMTLLGGRSVHPVSVCIGGFWKTPHRAEVLAFKPKMERALELALGTARFVGALNLPELDATPECVALSHPREYGMNEGHIVSSSGLDIPIKDFEQTFLEEHVAHSTALQAVRAERGSSYLVGPLARVNLNRDRLSAAAQQAARESCISWPCFNPYAGIVARSIELVHACEESLERIVSYAEPEKPSCEYSVRAGEGCAATEAPRGLLYHRYRINDRGIVQSARIVPPTCQNYRRIEDDIRALVPPILDRPDEEIMNACERLVRNYDPCISCSTHAVKLHIRRH